ncbi:MAG: transglycosylase domain-containing protein [Parvularculaceae bacterium]
MEQKPRGGLVRALGRLLAALGEDLREGARAFAGDFRALWRRLTGRRRKQDAEAEAEAAISAEAPQALEPAPVFEESDAPPIRKSGWLARIILAARLSVAASSLAFVGLIGGLYAVFVVVAPRVPEGADLWNVNRQPSVVVLDRRGEEIAARGARYGEAVGLDEMPSYLTAAILATEDRRFYEHNGVDARGLARAIFANLRSGAVVQGGSTITQQLAKNLFLSSERSYLRKAREALLAIWLESRYSKDEILSIYLNRIYLGAGAYGVESASKTYFGKSVRDINLGEAVMLAGLPKAPSSLAPTQNPFGAQKRAEEVLDNLLETGAVTPFEAREARLNPPKLVSGDRDVELGYFFDYVAARAQELARDYWGDLVVKTTIDAKMQVAAEHAVANALDVEARLAGADQAALIAYGTDGGLRAMVGGRSYLESQFNRATQARRQPGSAFKPFVYVAALEAGLTPQSKFVDQPVEIEGWKPTNYTEGYRGPVRLTEAVAKSINTVAVQVSERAGRENVAEAAHRLGFRSEVPTHPSIALGAVNVTLEELTGAYLPFARGGMSVEPYAIENISDHADKVIYQHRNERPTRLLTRKVSADMNHFLYQVLYSGTGRAASLGSRPAAGKTGTTNDWRDAWFIGYTAQMTAGVWVGNDDYRPMDKITGGTLPAAIWRDFMVAAHQGLPEKSFPGAYPAVSYASEPVLVQFYSDVARGLERVRRDGRVRSSGRRRRN